MTATFSALYINGLTSAQGSRVDVGALLEHLARLGALTLGPKVVLEHSVLERQKRC